MTPKYFSLNKYQNNNLIKLLKRKKINLIKINIDTNNRINLNDMLNAIYKKKVSTLLVEGGKDLTNAFIANKLFNEFYLFKSSKNLANSGSINIMSTLKLLSKSFKKHNLLDTYTNKDKIIKFF